MGVDSGEIGGGCGKVSVVLDTFSPDRILSKFCFQFLGQLVIMIQM